MSKRMLHLWIRAEQRKNEKRVGITPLDASKLLSAGIKVTVEDSADRIIPIEEYNNCLLYTSPSPRDATLSRMPSSA